MKKVYILPKNISIEEAENFTDMDTDLIKYGKDTCDNFFCLYEEEDRGDSWSTERYFNTNKDKLKKQGFEFIYYMDFIGEIR